MVLSKLWDCNCAKLPSTHRQLLYFYLTSKCGLLLIWYVIKFSNVLPLMPSPAQSFSTPTRRRSFCAVSLCRVPPETQNPAVIGMLIDPLGVLQSQSQDSNSRGSEYKYKLNRDANRHKDKYKYSITYWNVICSTLCSKTQTPESYTSEPKTMEPAHSVHTCQPLSLKNLEVFAHWTMCGPICASSNPLFQNFRLLDPQSSRFSNILKFCTCWTCVAQYELASAHCAIFTSPFFCQKLLSCTEPGRPIMNSAWTSYHTLSAGILKIGACRHAAYWALGEAT